MTSPDHFCVPFQDSVFVKDSGLLLKTPSRALFAVHQTRRRHPRPIRTQGENCGPATPLKALHAVLISINFCPVCRNQYPFLPFREAYESLLGVNEYLLCDVSTRLPTHGDEEPYCSTHGKIYCGLCSLVAQPQSGINPA